VQRVRVRQGLLLRRLSEETFPYEKPDRHHLPDDCRVSWKCGDEF